MDSKYIEELIEKDVRSLGCSIWGIELIGSTRNRTLRIYIDKDIGISISDCEEVSKHISKVLEASNLLISSQNLEVSSPGVDRKFFKKDQYLKYIGQCIKVRFLKEKKGFETKRGILVKILEDSLFLRDNNQDTEIFFNSIHKANLEFKGD